MTKSSACGSFAVCFLHPTLCLRHFHVSPDSDTKVPCVGDARPCALTGFHAKQLKVWADIKEPEVFVRVCVYARARPCDFLNAAARIRGVCAALTEPVAVSRLLGCGSKRSHMDVSRERPRHDGAHLGPLGAQ